MTIRDLVSGLGPSTSINAQAVTATLNGTGVDLRGFDSAMVLIDAGLAGGTSPSFTVVVQESDDDATYTAVAAGDLQGGGQLTAITTANDQAIYKRGYIGAKRYLRVAVTAVSGTSPTLPLSASIVRGHPHGQPV